MSRRPTQPFRPLRHPTAVSPMRRFPFPRPFTILTLALSVAGVAAGQVPAGADAVLRNFVFSTGDTMPELRIHYIALGHPQRDSRGTVRNAVIINHGTTGSGSGFTSRTFGGELFGPGQL